MRTLSASVITSALILALTYPTSHAQLDCETTNDPVKVNFFYEDLHNFIRAVDALANADDTVAALKTEYLDKASPGLSEYLREKKITAQSFAEWIRKRPETLDSLRALPEQLISQEKKIREALDGLRRVMPHVTFVPAYYFVGVKGGLFAEPSPYGLLVAITEPADEVELDAVRLVITHETVHVQQALTVGMEEYFSIFGPKMSLLALAIREGTADFLTRLSTGDRTLKEAYDYFSARELQVWKRFQEEMGEGHPGEWMWAKPSDPEQPRDLGYVIGSAIVEEYYRNADDKGKAIHEILSVTDYQDFLKRSRYADKFTKSD